MPVQFLHLSSDAEWQRAEQITHSRLITTEPGDAHAVVLVHPPPQIGDDAAPGSQDQWALLRCPINPPYSLTLECCGPFCALNRRELMNVVQQVARYVMSVTDDG